MVLCGIVVMVNWRAAAMPFVELHQAFMWDCDECGTENLARAVTVDLPPDDMANMLNAFGVEPWEEGQLLTAPTRVKCQSCGSEFDVVVPER